MAQNLKQTPAAYGVAPFLTLNPGVGFMYGGDQRPQRISLKISIVTNALQLDVLPWTLLMYHFKRWPNHVISVGISSNYAMARTCV